MGYGNKSLGNMVEYHLMEYANKGVVEFYTLARYKEVMQLSRELPVEDRKNVLTNDHFDMD